MRFGPRKVSAPAERPLIRPPHDLAPACAPAIEGHSSAGPLQRWYNPVQVSPERSRTAVVVADDHPLFRRAVIEAIKARPSLEFVGEAGDGREALESIRETRPDVAVLDVRMPKLDGLGVLNAVVRDGLPTRVIFLTAHIDSGGAYEAVGAGAAAYLAKEAS